MTTTEPLLTLMELRALSVNSRLPTGDRLSAFGSYLEAVMERGSLFEKRQVQNDLYHVISELHGQLTEFTSLYVRSMDCGSVEVVRSSHSDFPQLHQVLPFLPSELTDTLNNETRSMPPNPL